MLALCSFFLTQAQALTLKAVHWEDVGMIESSLANTFVGSKHKSKALNWHALWEREKKEKSCRWSHNCILRCTFKHKNITRFSAQTSKNKQALLPDWQYFLSSFSHSHISLQLFCLVVHLQQTAKTAMIKPVPLINWPSDKFDSCTFDLGRTLDSCGFFSEGFPALFPSTAGGFQAAEAHTMWGRTWTPAAKPSLLLAAHACSSTTAKWS